MQNEIEVRDKQIELLNDRVLTLDHEVRQLQGYKSSMKAVEEEREKVVAELKKKVG